MEHIKQKISEYFAEAKLKFAEANNIYFFYFQFQSEKIYVFQEKKNLCVISERKQKLSFTCWSQGENLLLDGLLLWIVVLSEDELLWGK